MGLTSKSQYIRNFISGIGGAVISTTLGLVSAPLALSYWKEERYGLWALILSVLTYLHVSNFGIGQAAAVLMAKNCDLKDKKTILRKSFSLMLISMATVAVIVIIIATFTPQWIRLLGKIPVDLESEARTTCIFIVLFYFLNLPFSLMSSLLVGTQRAYIDNVFQIMTTVCNFIGLVSVILCKLTMPWMAILNGCFILIVNLVKTAVAYSGSERGELLGGASTVAPLTGENEDVKYKNILSASLRFFLIWLVNNILWNSDNFIISNLIGLKEVASYSLTFKFYNLLFSCIFIFNNSMQPIFSKEFGANNWTWISKRYRSFTVLSGFLGGLAAMGGILFGEEFIMIWTGKTGYAGLLVQILLGAYSYSISTSHFCQQTLGAFNYTKWLWSVILVEVIVRVASSVILGRILGLGGIAAGTLLGSLAGPFWMYPFLAKRRSEGRLKIHWKGSALHFCAVLLPLMAVSVIMKVHVDNGIANLLIGIALTLAYLTLSWIISPKEVKNEISLALREMAKKLAGNRRLT